MKLLATVFMILAAATMGLTQVLLRWAGVGDDAAAFQLSFFKYGFTMIAVLAYYRREVRTAAPVVARLGWPLLVFGVSDSIATLLLFMGSIRLPLAINSVVSDLHVLITPLILALAGIERVTGLQYGAIALGVVGAAFVTGVAETGVQVSWAWVLPFGAAALWCLSSLSARSLSQVSKGFPQGAVGLFGFLAAAAALFFLKAPPWPEAGRPALLVLAVVAAMASQMFFVLSMTSGEVVAALAGIPAYAFFGAVFGYVFFGEALGCDQLFGIGAILGGLLLLSWPSKRP
jgi:drug/metabolite transporter (DMT)-like permease